MIVKKSDLQRFLNDYGIESDEDTIRSYSGRGMFGRECLGIVFQTLSEFLEFVYSAGQEQFAHDEGYSGNYGSFYQFCDRITSVRSDSMGLSTIYYWPGVQVED